MNIVILLLLVYVLVGCAMFLASRRFSFGGFEILFWPLLFAIAVATVTVMIAANILIAFLSPLCEAASLFSRRRQ